MPALAEVDAVGLVELIVLFVFDGRAAHVETGGNLRMPLFVKPLREGAPDTIKYSYDVQYKDGLSDHEPWATLTPDQVTSILQMHLGSGELTPARVQAISTMRQDVMQARTSRERTPFAAARSSPPLGPPWLPSPAWSWITLRCATHN